MVQPLLLFVATAWLNPQATSDELGCDAVRCALTALVWSCAAPPVAHSGPFPWLLRGTPEDGYPPNMPAGVKVAVGNLPRKKKVGRDLRKALVAVPGLLVIRPAEEGDRDTRDCTCKGSASLIFEDQQYAAG